MSFLISVRELKEKIESGQEVIIVDTRFQLNDPQAGRKAFEKSHLPNAVFFDLENDLSGDIGEHGGNHPLPEPDVLAEKLGQAGIDRDTEVVVYDQQNDMFAARFWWLLHFLGHDRVFILDGGYDAWVRAGYAVTNEKPIINTKSFWPEIRSNEVVDIEMIKSNIKTSSAALIDSRSYDRYLGKVEPLYQKAGHIPGAKSYFWMDVLNKDGGWKSKKELQQHFSKLDKDVDIIVSCGSGVSACPNILALKMAGYQNVKLYPGSFSDWISYDENQVETKDEN
ncbi:sulfurtransferase [Ornithinibacillus bavariensis]|uniref:sulfurtransferase n=1 Tax=Ornithinibacillus bavariensis TaxID=545502 RepID=UPI000ECDA23E|nr:sulfurtransferase [Ornithinibacillus sp.]